MKPEHPSISKEEKQIKGRFAPRVPKSRKEEAEFGAGKEDIIMCPDCTIFYYYKSWHHNLEKYREDLDDKRIKFIRCPACEMLKDKKFEGQVIVSDVPEKHRKDLINLIINVGNRAFKRDPLDRIIKITKRGRGLIIYTTENQLALSIAKQIKRAFKNFKKVPEIIWSHEESTARVKW